MREEAKPPASGKFQVSEKMAYRIVSIPIPDSDSSAEELNVFLSTHRIISKSWETVMRDGVPYQVCRVEYAGVNGGVDSEPHGRSSFSKPPRVDYREKLSEKDFGIFDQLRQWRKRQSESESVDAYIIFTNEQF